MKLEFTTTACARPELLDQTYESLHNALVDVNTRREGTLYINIDPVPDSSEKIIEREIEVARHFFKEVYYRIGEPGGNFSTAASWVLSQPKGDYFFNVEDDWIFTGKITIQKFIDEIQSCNRDNMLQCCAGGSMRHRQNRIYFPPSLFQTSVIQSILNKHPIPEDENPEKWLWELKDPKQIVDYNICCVGDGIRCFDIGRQWMKKNGLRRLLDEGGILQGNFTKWCSGTDKYN